MKSKKVLVVIALGISLLGMVMSVFPILDAVGQVVRDVGHAAGEVVEGAGRAAGDIIEGTGEAVSDIVHGDDDGDVVVVEEVRTVERPSEPRKKKPGVYFSNETGIDNENFLVGWYLKDDTGKESKNLMYKALSNRVTVPAVPAGSRLAGFQIFVRDAKGKYVKLSNRINEIVIDTIFTLKCTGAKKIVNDQQVCKIKINLQK